MRTFCETNFHSFTQLQKYSNNKEFPICDKSTFTKPTTQFYMHFDISQHLAIFMNTYSIMLQIFVAQYFRELIQGKIFWELIHNPTVTKIALTKFTMVHSPQWAWVHEAQPWNFYHENEYLSNFQSFHEIFGPRKFGAIRCAGFSLETNFKGGKPMFLELGGGRWA